MKQTSVKDRERAVRLHKDGKSYGEISKIIKRSRSTVQYIISRYEKKNLIENELKIYFTKKLSTCEEHWILQKVKQNPKISAPKVCLEIKKLYNKIISESTIRRLLRKYKNHCKEDEHKCYSKTEDTSNLNAKTNQFSKNEKPNDLASVGGKKRNHLESDDNTTLEVVNNTESALLIENKEEFVPEEKKFQLSQQTSSLIEELFETAILDRNVCDVLKTKAINLFSQWCVKHYRPFELAKDIGLRRFAQLIFTIGANYGDSIDINDVLPDPTTISQSIGNQYEAAFEKLKNEISKECTNGHGLTLKLWTDTYSQQRYISLMIHYIKNAEMNSKFLGLKAVPKKQNFGKFIYCRSIFYLFQNSLFLLQIMLL